jgi:hypothetical protein
VPVEVLRCVPRRYLAGEGFDGGGWEEVIPSFFEGFCRVMGTIHQLPKIQQNSNYLIFYRSQLDSPSSPNS